MKRVLLLSSVLAVSASIALAQDEYGFPDGFSTWIDSETVNAEKSIDEETGFPTLNIIGGTSRPESWLYVYAPEGYDGIIGGQLKPTGLTKSEWVPVADYIAQMNAMMVPNVEDRPNGYGIPIPTGEPYYGYYSFYKGDMVDVETMFQIVGNVVKVLPSVDVNFSEIPVRAGYMSEGEAYWEGDVLHVDLTSYRNNGEVAFELPANYTGLVGNLAPVSTETRSEEGWEPIWGQPGEDGEWVSGFIDKLQEQGLEGVFNTGNYLNIPADGQTYEGTVYLSAGEDVNVTRSFKVIAKVERLMPEFNGDFSEINTWVSGAEESTSDWQGETLIVKAKSIEDEIVVGMNIPEGFEGIIGNLNSTSFGTRSAEDWYPLWGHYEWIDGEEVFIPGAEDELSQEPGYFRTGNWFSIPADGKTYEGMIYLVNGDQVYVARPFNVIACAYNPEKNQAAYEESRANIAAQYNEFEVALAEAKEAYPSYDFDEWQEIIVNAFNEAFEGAKQALKAANDEGVAYFFPFNGEEIEAMIAEMKKAPIVSENQDAYEEVMAKIEVLQVEYEAALSQAKDAYPSYDFAEWEEIIGGALDQAKEGAAQALASANEDGAAFQYAFEGEDIIDMIAEMKREPLIPANQAAYEEVIAQLDALQAQYEAAVAEIKETNPDFDFTEWEEIGTMIESYKAWALQALESANEDGESFNFPAGTEDIAIFINEMIKKANAPVFPASFDVTFNGQASLDLIEATQGEEDGVYTIKVSGMSLEDKVTVALAVPAGWDGFVSMSDADFNPEISPLTRAYESEWTPVYELLENGFKESNQLTFTTDGEEHLGVFMLVKDGEADEMNQIMVEFNVTNPTSGVAGVETIDPNARYFDFNGHQIARPAAGMYIKVLNGKATKVIVK